MDRDIGNKRIEMGEENWKIYQIERAREDAIKQSQHKDNMIFNGRKIKDISGMRCGKLIAIRPVDLREKQKGITTKTILWECKCDCGETIILRTSRITGKERKSCGCLRLGGRGAVKRGYQLREDMAKPNERFGNIPVIYYHTIQSRAKHRGIDFKVSINYLNDLFIKQGGACKFSGQELKFFSGKCYHDTTASLDRIDSKKPCQLPLA